MRQFGQRIGKHMAIANAVQRGQLVYVYNEKNTVTATLPAGNGVGDGLKGYTGSRVNIQRNNLIYSYDERGSVMGTMPAR